MFFPSALPCEVLVDIVALLCRALQNQDAGAMVLACRSAVLAPGFGGLIRKCLLSSKLVPQHLTNDSLGAFKQIYHKLPADLTRST